MPPALSRSRERPVVVRAGQATGERVRMGVYDLLPGMFAVGCTFYYRGGLDTAAVRDSLARTLVRYPPLTGRMERTPDGGMGVVCSDAGALFAEVHSDLPMPDPLLGLLVEAVLDLDLVQRPWQQGDRAGPGGRGGARVTVRAGQAVGLGEAELKVFVALDAERPRLVLPRGMLPAVGPSRS